MDPAAPHSRAPASVVAALPARWRPLTGGTAVWVFMSVEVATFGLFLLGHAWGWRGQPAVFAASQDLLHVGSAVRGTALLLWGSWLAYQGALAHGAGRHAVAGRWLAAASVAGLLFSVNKVAEYGSAELAGVTLSTNGFWFSYLFLTGLHLLHVLGGVALFAWLAWSCSRGPVAEDAPMSVDTAAVYWHLVDLIWVLLFPILYLMRP